MIHSTQHTQNPDKQLHFDNHKYNYVDTKDRSSITDTLVSQLPNKVRTTHVPHNVFTMQNN